MPYQYRPRGMPSRFMEGAPDIVRRGIIDITGPHASAVCGYDMIFRPEPDAAEIVGLDFGIYGERGCHFFLKPYEMRTYRERNRHKRVAWLDLPEATRRAVLDYLAE